jgi:hypothetical protein
MERSGINPEPLTHLKLIKMGVKIRLDFLFLFDQAKGMERS